MYRIMIHFNLFNTIVIKYAMYQSLNHTGVNLLLATSYHNSNITAKMSDEFIADWDALLTFYNKGIIILVWQAIRMM